MSAEKPNEQYNKALEAVEKTKYSIISLLVHLGGSREKASYESRKDIWKKYEKDIRKGTSIDSKYTGSAEQNTAMLNYIKNRIRNNKELFNANTYEFTSLTGARSTLRSEVDEARRVHGILQPTVTTETPPTAPISDAKGRAEEVQEAKEEAKRIAEREKKEQAEDEKEKTEVKKGKPEKAEWEKMQEAGEERDNAYLTKIKKDLDVFNTFKSPDGLKAEIQNHKATLDPQVIEHWVNEKNNSGWIDINAAGRDAAYTHLSAMNLGIDDLKEVIKKGTVSRQDLYRKLGYKNSDKMVDSLIDANFEGSGYKFHIGKYAEAAENLKKAKKEKADEKTIEKIEIALEEAKKGIERDRPAFEKVRPMMEKVSNAIIHGKKLLEVLDNKELFFHNKQTAIESEEKLDEATQKTLDGISEVFKREGAGPAIEDSDRVITMLNLSRGTFTKDTGYFERHSSFGAAYDDVESQVLDITSSDKTHANTVKLLNQYIETALTRTGKSSEIPGYKVTPEMLKSGSIPENFKSLIRIGYIINLQTKYAIEKARRIELMETYSKNPEVVKLLKEFKLKKPNLTDAELRHLGRSIDGKLTAGIMLGVTENNGKYGPAIGGGIAIPLVDDYCMTVGLTGIIDAETGNPVANIFHLDVGKKIKLTKDTKLILGLGVSGVPGVGVGASAVIETPIGETTDVVFGGGVGVDLLKLQAGAGGLIGLKWNPERSLKNETEEKYKKFGIWDIETSKNRYKAIMEHPKLGKEIGAALEAVDADRKTKGEEPLSDEYKRTIALEIYESMKDDMDATAIAEIDPTGINGGGVMVSASILPIMPYITIGYGKKTRVLRLVDATTAEISDAELKKQLDKDIAEAGGTKFIDLGTSGRVVMDKEGRTDVLFDKTVQYKAEEGNNLEMLNKSITRAKVRFEEASDGLLKMNIQNSRNANINIHLDPELKNTHLVYDAKNFFLNTDLSKNLLITRKEYRYPYKKEGAYREIHIYIKKDAVGESTLEGTKHDFLERNVGKAILETGLRSTVSDREKGNLLDYQTFLKMQKEGKIEKFDIPNEKEFEDALKKIIESPATREFMEKKEEPIRDNLEQLTKDFYGKDKKYQTFLKKLTTEYNPSLETDYKKILADFEAFIQKNGEKKPLTQLERSFFRNILIELTFRDITKRTPKERRETLNREAKWIRETFMRYLEKTPQADRKEQIADIVMDRIMSSTFNESEFKEIDPAKIGDQFISMVGTEKIVGARRSHDYDRKRFKMINPQEYRIRAINQGEHMVAKALLEIISPLDTSSPETLLRSPLSRKLAPLIPFAFSPEDVDLYLDLVEKNMNPNCDEKHKAFYDKFSKMVMKVREIENTGERRFTLGEEYNSVGIELDITSTVGLFEKCQNFTVMGKEELKFSVPRIRPVFGGAGAETHIKVSSRLQTRYKEVGLAFGFFPTGINEKTIEGGDGGGGNQSTGQESTGQVAARPNFGKQGEIKAPPKTGGGIEE